MEHDKTVNPNINYEDLMADQIRWILGLLNNHTNFYIKHCCAFNDIKSIIYDENIHTLSAQLDDLFKDAWSIPNSSISKDHLMPVKDAKSVQDLCGIGLARFQYIDRTMLCLSYEQHLLCMIALLGNKGFPISSEISNYITPLIQNVADLVSSSNNGRSCEVFLYALIGAYL
jgi:hypothetical protein